MRAALLLLLTCTAFATTQERENLVVGSEVHKVRGDAFSSSMISRFQEYVRENGTPWSKSSNWKGYHVALRIEDGSLRIDHIAFDRETRESPESILGVTVPQGGLVASWFSGELVEPFGEHTSFLVIWSHERVFEFKDGKLVRLFERKNPDFQKYRAAPKKG